MSGFQLTRLEKALRICDRLDETPEMWGVYAETLRKTLFDMGQDITKLRDDVDKLRGSSGGRTVRGRQMNVKDRLWESRPHVCEQCSAVLTWSIFRPHHVIPVSEGGTDDDGNLQMLCLNCHMIAHT